MQFVVDPHTEPDGYSEYLADFIELPALPEIATGCKGKRIIQIMGLDHGDNQPLPNWYEYNLYRMETEDNTYHICVKKGEYNGQKQGN